MAKHITVVLAVLLVVACADTPTTPAPLAPDAPSDLLVITPGQAGQTVFSVGRINMNNNNCWAQYKEPASENGAILSRQLADRIRVTANKNRIKATCKFLDASGAYDANAETGPIESCSLVMTDGTVYDGGTGRVTSAANIFDDVDGYPFGTGGQTTLQCTFEL